MTPDEQPKTKEIPAVSAEEIAITQLTRAVETGFREMRADLGLVSNDLGILKDRVGILESAKNDQDNRATRTSYRVEQASQQDMAHEAKLGQALAELAEAKAKCEVLERTSATKDDLKKIADAQTTDIVKSLSNAADRSPTVRNLMLAVAGLIFLGINTATVYLTRPPAPPTPPPTSITVTK